jgi:hypothetical protein
MICKNCHKPREEHFFDLKYAWLTSPIWCNKIARSTAYKSRNDQTRMGADFCKILVEIATWNPMNNLDYVEYEAQRRKLI